MRVLLDEHLPFDLMAEFVDQDVANVRSQGWAGLKNGVLLDRAAEAGFDVLVTNDRGIEHQVNLSAVRLGIVVLDAPSNRLRDLLQRVPGALEAIAMVKPGEVRHVGG